MNEGYLGNGVNHSINYFHDSNAHQRSQTKWVVAQFTGGIHHDTSLGWFHQMSRWFQRLIVSKFPSIWWSMLVCSQSILIVVYKCLTILKSMWCFHNQILFDDEYISECYPITIASRNPGWLCLVAKPYFTLGNTLLHKICSDKIMEKLEKLRTGHRGAIKKHVRQTVGRQ